MFGTRSPESAFTVNPTLPGVVASWPTDSSTTSNVKLTLTQRIMLVAAAPLLLAGVILSIAYVRDAKAHSVQQMVEKSRSVILAAESAREEMGDKWAKGLFSAEQLRGWAAQGDTDRILQAVPVVTAWRVAMRKADEGGCKFRVAKFSPRNSKNAPDDTETRVIKMFDSDPTLVEMFGRNPDYLCFSKCLGYLARKSDIFRTFGGRGIYVYQSNQSYWRRLVDPDLNVLDFEGAAYRLADGRIIDINSMKALRHWGESFGYRSRVIPSFHWLRRNAVVVFER